MKKSVSVLLLCIVFIFALSAPAISSAHTLPAQPGACDTFVYAPGIYDLVVTCSEPDAKFRWCARVGSDGRWLELDDNEGYHGTNTNHLKFYTTDVQSYYHGDWEEVRFSCKVTVGDVSEMISDSGMWIATHETLLRHLKEDGVELGMYGIRSGGYTSVEEKDGVKYYNVTAGKTFYPYANYSPPSQNRAGYQMSEIEFKTELLVTENGKTIVCTSDKGYTPKKTGQGNITVRANLVLYQKGERMEVLDTKTFVVNVLTPEGIGAGVTNASCSVLDSMYPEAPVLTRLEKGAYVTVVSEKGGYYEVVAGGYAGYIYKTAVTVSENIYEVGVTIAEPSDYAVMSTDVVLEHPELYELYKIDPVMWDDKTADRFLEPGDQFLPNHTYTLTIWLKAKEGKRFNQKYYSPDVSADINGRSAKAVKAYEQDPTEVISVEYTFTHVHDLKKVNRVYPTCTTDGKELYYQCSCGARFEDNYGKTPITDENWGVIPALGHWESEWRSNGTEHYKVCQRRECGQTIEGTKGKHTGGQADCAHKAVCTVCGLPYGDFAAHNWSGEWNYVTEEGHAHLCNNICGQHSEIVAHRPGPAATETTPQVCLDCGYIISQPVSHTHKLRKVGAVEPTCTKGGNLEYYVCDSCGSYFSDAEGKNKITAKSVTLIALGHSQSDKWENDEHSHWHVCTRCGIKLAETEGQHTFKTGDLKCTVCGYETPHETVTETDTAKETETTPDTEIETETDTETETEPSTGTEGQPETTQPQTEAETTTQNEKKGLPPIIIVLIIVCAVLLCLVVAAVIILINKSKKK